VEGRRGLAAQLLAVHDEQRLAQLAGFGDALEEGGGDEGLAGPGGQREQRPRRLPLLSALGELLQHGADGGILIIAAGALAAWVAGQQRRRLRRVQAEAGPGLVAGAQLVGRGELRQRAGRADVAGAAVVFDEQVAVAAEDERHVEAFAVGIGAALLEAMRRWQMLGLGLDQRHRDRLGAGMDLDAQRVIDAAPGLLARLPVNDGDRAGRLFPPNKIFGSAPSVDRRVDQLGPGIGFGERRDLSCPMMTARSS
jgi:hypothetical protein